LKGKDFEAQSFQPRTKDPAANQEARQLAAVRRHATSLNIVFHQTPAG